MKVLNVAMLAAFLSGIAVAYAAEQTITEKGKVFSATEVTVKKARR